MIILSNDQLYAAVRRMVVSLEECGMNGDADKLRAALSVSTLPGEILGEIRLVLQGIERGRLPKAADYEIASEITYITSVLG